MADRKLNLIGIVVLALVILLVFLNIKKAPSEGSVEGKRLMPTLSQLANDIQGVEFVQGESSSFFKRIENTWVDISRDNFPIEFERVKEHLVALSSIRGDQALTSNPKRYAALSLDWPDVDGNARLVRLYSNTNDLPVAEIILGREKWNPESVYVRLMGEPQCWRSNARIPFELNGTRWMNRTISTIATSNIKSVAVGPLTIYRENSSEEWVVEKLADDVGMSEEKMQNAKTIFPSLLNRLEFEDVRAAGSQFDGNPDVSILYTLDGGSVTLECYKEEESYWFSLKSVVKILDDEAGQSSEEAREVSWIEQTKSWGGWQYRMTSWRSNQIEELFDLEEEIEAPEE